MTGAERPAVMSSDDLLGGRYRLENIAGHGGMATVFAATDTTLDRPVAVKILARRHDAGGVVEQRFRREAFAEARVVHPNVIAVHDIGETADGRPFIVMEFVEGRTLADLLAEGRLPSERVAMLGTGLARALDAAHEAGVVHRDVKPANVLIDAHGLPHLTDFGLARAIDEHEADITSPGTLLGSAHYVSPEQARYGTSTAQSDLYSLGALLYHATAGEPPFPGQGPIDIALRRFEEDPPDLVTRVPDSDPFLAALIHTMMAREPAERPQSAHAVAERMLDIAARLRALRTSADVMGMTDH